MRRISVGLAGGLILMLLAGAVNVFAAGGTADSGQDRTGSITINYYDDADGKKGISGAGFRSWKRSFPMCGESGTRSGASVRRIRWRPSR